LASVDQDCLNSSFYIKNISVDITKESINEARSQAEQKAKLIGFKRLTNRLIIKNLGFNFNTIDIFSLVDYLKINEEANSDKRYLANFDICFNRNLVIKFFRKNKFQYAETYREPIAVLPIFKGPRGYVLWDEKDDWYLNWQNKLKIIDGLVKLKLAKGNFSLNRNLKANLLLKLNEDQINKLINNENTNALILVVAEPILMRDGKTYLSTYGKFYNKSGKIRSTIYRNSILLKRTSSFYNVDKALLEKEVSNMIKSIETNWKKNNLIDTRIYNEVDLIIPITQIKSTLLSKNLLFNDKSIIVKSTSDFKDQGFLKIKNEIIFYKTKTKNTFDNIKRNVFNSSNELKYEKNINVIQKDTGVWPDVLNILEKLPFVIEVKILSITSTQGRLVAKFMGNKKTFFQAIYEKKLKFKDFNSQQYILIN
tara:strand:- start:3021 stop:4292 length:1272 start_codon:yes stop_codon:yes gene_type:complete